MIIFAELIPASTSLVPAHISNDAGNVENAKFMRDICIVKEITTLFNDFIQNICFLYVGI